MPQQLRQRIKGRENSRGHTAKGSEKQSKRQRKAAKGGVVALSHRQLSYTDQIVDQLIVAVAFSLTKFWLSDRPQH